MRLTEVLLQGARINPLIYETISTCWIFTDSFFEANGWLTLYRESEYDDEFKSMAYEYWGPELRYLREIFIHFRLGHTGLSQSWVPCFNSPVYNAVERGYIKVYKLDKGKQFRSSQELSVASHPIWSQHLQREYAEGSINQLRATLACALSESLDGRWYERDVENRMLYNQGFGTRMAYRLGHTVKGAADSVVESLQELIHIGVVLFKGVQAGYRAYLELRHDIDEKGAAAITERMHALGIKIEQGVDKVTALLKQGLSMLNTILSDPYCRGYLFEYFDGLKESISELGRCRMIGGFIGEVGILFILALATGGIGLIPRAAQLIGGLSYKVLKVMLKIYDALQAKAGQALEMRRAAQLKLDLELNRSIAPKVLTNKANFDNKVHSKEESAEREQLSSVDIGGASPNKIWTKRSIFNSYPERIVLLTSGIDEQAAFLSKHVSGLSYEQATLILNHGFKRESSVVIGGSRVRGDFIDGSDLDVGFGGFTEKQHQNVVKNINKTASQNAEFLYLEKLQIVPGKRTATIDPIITPEEFFQRSGIRSLNDGKKAGQAYVPSGSITLTSDGKIIVIPPGAEL